MDRGPTYTVTATVTTQLGDVLRIEREEPLSLEPVFAGASDYRVYVNGVLADPSVDQRWVIDGDVTYAFVHGELMRQSTRMLYDAPR